MKRIWWVSIADRHPWADFSDPVAWPCPRSLMTLKWVRSLLCTSLVASVHCMFLYLIRWRFTSFWTHHIFDLRVAASLTQLDLYQ
jgi:hypothetical protein